MNKLPKSWAVKNDGSQRFKDLVIGYILKTYGGWKSEAYDDLREGLYYGVYNDEGGNGYSGSSTDFKCILQLDSFEELLNANKRRIEISLETAKTLWKGFTWEDSFEGEGYQPYGGGVNKLSTHLVRDDINRRIFKTQEQALSALAFAQLSHICAKYNEGKKRNMERRWFISEENNKIKVFICCESKEFLEFFTEKDAEQSLITNKKLWEQFWMLSTTDK